MPYFKLTLFSTICSSFKKAKSLRIELVNRISKIELVKIFNTSWTYVQNLKHVYLALYKKIRLLCNSFTKTLLRYYFKDCLFLNTFQKTKEIAFKKVFHTKFDVSLLCSDMLSLHDKSFIVKLFFLQKRWIVTFG